MKDRIYQIIDSFLTESKNQHGQYRSIERLNDDRHLAADAFEKLMEEQKRDFIDFVWNMKFREVKNMENIENYNNKKLGFYQALQQIRRELK